MPSFVQQLRSQRNHEAVKPCTRCTATRQGYYLIKSDTYHFIAETVNPSALDRVADRVLNDRVGYDYWIDYFHGPDVFGDPAWSNMDQTDKFI